MISLNSPVKTRAHAWPAWIKLSGLSIATVLLFLITNYQLHILIFVILLVIYALPGRIFFRTGIKQLRMLWPFILIVALWHGYNNELLLGVELIFRMLNALALANLVTLCTRLSDMIDVVHMICMPLRKFGLKSRALELSIALVIRITPVLVEKGTMLSDAWRARSARRAGWRIILPFSILALDDADQVSQALRARGGINIDT